MDSEEKKRFDEDGFVIIKNFFDSDFVQRLKHAGDELVSEKIRALISQRKMDNLLESEPFETRLIKLKEINAGFVPLLFRAELHREAFYDLFGNPKLLSVVSELMPEADDIRIFPNYSCRPKLPNFEPHQVVWHQDAGLSADGRPNTSPVEARMSAFGPGMIVNVWTPLVEATATTGCMKAIPGSHKLGLQEHVTAFRYRSGKEEHTYGNYAAEILPEVIAKHEASAVDLSCSPGDVILFSNILFHRGGQNTSDMVRWSFDWRYQDASKPTYRQESGHVMWSRTNQDKVVKSAEEWAKLSLT